MKVSELVKRAVRVTKTKYKAKDIRWYLQTEMEKWRDDMLLNAMAREIANEILAERFKAKPKKRRKKKRK